MSDYTSLKNELVAAINNAADLAQLENIRVNELGKKGRLAEAMSGLGKMSPDERKKVGAELNVVKQEINDAFAARKSTLEQGALTAKLASEKIDITLPAPTAAPGKIHPIAQVIDEVTAIFAAQGFVVAEGPDIDTQDNNFTALNIPESHPARQMHDTFYLNAKDEKGLDLLLRTHTSTVQIRTMTKQKPPLRILAPGRTFRSDSDMTHTPMFHQIEGFVVDESTHFGHLKGCLIEFVRAFFELSDVPVRFRPSFFPFTEPSAEMDIGCSRKDGGLKIGAGDSWLEILGCGMIHPKVLENCGIDSKKYQGFAFGMGVERLAMLKYGIPDLRSFFGGDSRWLDHYGFSALDVPSMAGGLSR
ncbi:MAG: phenylalanine--tRNA ligase subunit alpha [Alphaproteobacteria bacterium]|nr:MAG: phenylalanine--tRNA ligase subunit alpha [Alphaproteobacteria bacterium]